MKTNEIASRIQKIGSLESVEDIRNELMTFQDELVTDYTERDNLVTSNETLTSANEHLRKVNNSLWMRTSTKEKPEEQSGLEEGNENKKLKYDDLFDENGGLK